MRCSVRPFLLIAVILLTSRPAVAGGNLLINGDFEAGNTGFGTDYTYATVNTPGDGGAGQYTVGTNPQLFNSTEASFGDHTTGKGLMLIANGAPDPNRTVWQETVAVVPGNTYSFSAWAASWGNVGGFDPSPPRLQFFIDSSVIGGTFSPPAADGQWSRFAIDWDSRVSSSVTLRIVDANTDRYGNDLALDDLSFAAVPEPSGLVLLGAGVVALLGHAARRARRSA